jgi:hypothetical protein
VYDAWLFVHLAGLLGFVAAHGVSAAAGLRLRRERDPGRIRALLDASAAARGLAYAGMALLAAGGLGDAFLGHWWGRGWVWASIILFAAMAGALVALAVPYYGRVRAAVDRASAGDGQGDLTRLLASPIPLLVLAIGAGGLGVILWLMVFKPF